MSFVVYKHTSPSGKVYIGITSRKPEYRWREGKGYTHNEYFFRAILKYGWINFKHEILFTGLSKEEAEQKEIALIQFYDSTNRSKGYNIKAGGDCCKASRETRIKMSRAMKGKGIGRFVGGKSPKARKINQYDLQGSFIKTWDSSTDIQRALHIDYASIVKCCRNQRKSAGGYQWRYFEDTEKEVETYKCTNARKRAVNQYTVDGVFIKTWESIAAANNKLGIAAGAISKVCSGKKHQTHGYIWRYAD